jgi:hypothetical protein
MLITKLGINSTHGLKDTSINVSLRHGQQKTKVTLTITGKQGRRPYAYFIFIKHL